VKVRAAGTFIAHLLCSTLGVLVSAAFLLFFEYGIIRIWNPLFTSTLASYTLTEIPGFPVQIVMGVMLGFVMGRRGRSRMIYWTWIVPLLCLLIAMAFAPSTSRPLLDHFFRDGCGPADGCIDQTALTLPFFASVAYSVGAGFARRHGARSESEV
jgi:hypothetical protein